MPTSPSADLKSQGLTVAPIKETPIFESNPKDSEENPTYVVSRQIGTIVEELPDEPKEEIPRYVVPQEDQGTRGTGSEDSKPSQWPDSDAVKSAITKHLPE